MTGSALDLDVFVILAEWGGYRRPDCTRSIAGQTPNSGDVLLAVILTSRVID
jgi:hypothetical protein